MGFNNLLVDREPPVLILTVSDPFHVISPVTVQLMAAAHPVLENDCTDSAMLKIIAK